MEIISESVELDSEISIEEVPEELAPCDPYITIFGTLTWKSLYTIALDQDSPINKFCFSKRFLSTEKSIVLKELHS